MHRRLACIRCFDDDPNPPYIEAVDILYSQNKFVVRLLKTVVDLQRTVLPHRLNLIRFLRIEVRFHFPVPLEVINDSKSHSRLPTDVGEMWLPTCRAISLMHGLHELHITVDDAWQNSESGKAEAMYAQFLQPLMDVVVPVFQVEIHPLFDVEMVLHNLARTPPFSLRPRTTQLWPKST
ncbi:hypothetical protein SLS56_012215 [Neofusicoccum ribis]|uniref:DUF7730 domain-containing protein n=1 Tax=Neofusicoccum ribis TaxID=45134 RepID=A0ABR3SAH6_9PEZI